jgi:hypothetical protein
LGPGSGRDAVDGGGLPSGANVETRRSAMPLFFSIYFLSYNTLQNITSHNTVFDEAWAD